MDFQAIGKLGDIQGLRITETISTFGQYIREVIYRLAIVLILSGHRGCKNL